VKLSGSCLLGLDRLVDEEGEVMAVRAPEGGC